MTPASRGQPSRGEAQGSIGRSSSGNTRRTQRIRQRTKALRSRRRASRSRRNPSHAEGRSAHGRPAPNGEKATTAVARAIRSIHAPDTTPEPGPPGDGRRSGVRLKGAVDAEQLLAREKLRRVERHRERSTRHEREPRRAAGPALRGRDGDAATSAKGRQGTHLRERTGSDRTPRPLSASAKNRVRHAGRLGRPETWRTPGSAAGRNKPAKCQVEQTVEAGRNGKGGTSPGGGIPGPKVAPRRRATSLGKHASGSSPEQRDHREWTPGTQVDGGADL
jgi:hypothetical protein